MHQSRDTKQLIAKGLLLRIRSLLVLCLTPSFEVFHSTPKNIEDRAIAHFTPYFVLFHFAIYLVQRESSK